MPRYENPLVKLSEQRYNQKAGLPFSKELMKQLSEQLTEICRDFLGNFSEPRNMYLESISTIATARRLEVELEFEDTRMAKISTDKHNVAGRKLNWGSWRQFNSTTEDFNKRKEVFDDFISKAPSIASFVEKRMAVSRDVYAEYGMKIAALLNKVRQRDPTALPAWKVLRLATVEGARTLGLADRVGTLEAGKEADIILIDLRKPHLTPVLSGPVPNIAPNLVYSARGSEVTTVIVGGQVVMGQGKVLTVDEDRIMEEAQRAAERVASAAEREFFAAGSKLADDVRAGLL